LCPGREATGSLTIRKRCRQARQSRQEQINVVKRRVYDDEKHIHFVTFSCYRRRKYLEVDPAKRMVIGQLGSKLANRDGRCPGFVVMSDHGSNIWSRKKVEEKLDYMHMNPVRAGLVDRAVDWR
jgi:putative transposase